MSKVCEITGSRPNVKNLVSHANNRTKKRQMPNIQWRKIWVPELGRTLQIRMSTRALRTLKKKSNLLQFLKVSGVSV